MFLMPYAPAAIVSRYDHDAGDFREIRRFPCQPRRAPGEPMVPPVIDTPFPEHRKKRHRRGKTYQ
jgi:hypothetical protein